MTFLYILSIVSVLLFNIWKYNHFHCFYIVRYGLICSICNIGYVSRKSSEYNWYSCTWNSHHINKGSYHHLVAVYLRAKNTHLKTYIKMVDSIKAFGVSIIRCFNQLFTHSTNMYWKWNNFVAWIFGEKTALLRYHSLWFTYYIIVHLKCLI